MRRRLLPCRPLIDDDAQIVQLLDGLFDGAAELGAVLGIGGWGLCNRDHASVAPGTGRDRRHGLAEVRGSDLRLLTVRGNGPLRGSLSGGGRGGVWRHNAELQRLGPA